MGSTSIRVDPVTDTELCALALAYPHLAQVLAARPWRALMPSLDP